MIGDNSPVEVTDKGRIELTKEGLNSQGEGISLSSDEKL